MGQDRRGKRLAVAPLESLDTALRGDVSVCPFQQARLVGRRAGQHAKAARTSIVVAMFEGLLSVSPQPPSAF